MGFKQFGGRLRSKQALAYCLLMGHPLSRMGLYVAAKKYGFGELVNGRMLFDRIKLRAYLYRAKRLPSPDKWMTMKEAAMIFKVSLQRVYQMKDENKIKCHRFGAGRGHHYVHK